MALGPVPAALRRAVVWIAADAGIGELAHVGPPDHDEASPAQPRHRYRILLCRRGIVERARAGAGHLALDVEEILDRDRDTGIARRRGLDLAQAIHRIRGGQRRILVDMDEGAPALAGRIGDFGDAGVDERAGGGAAAFEVFGELRQRRKIGHVCLTEYSRAIYSAASVRHKHCAHDGMHARCWTVDARWSIVASRSEGALEAGALANKAWEDLPIWPNRSVRDRNRPRRPSIFGTAPRRANCACNAVTPARMSTSPRAPSARPAPREKSLPLRRAARFFSTAM